MNIINEIKEKYPNIISFDFNSYSTLRENDTTVSSNHEDELLQRLFVLGLNHKIYLSQTNRNILYMGAFISDESDKEDIYFLYEIEDLTLEVFLKELT